MKNIVYIFILTTIIYSCEIYDGNRNSESQQIYSDGFKELEAMKNFELINLDSVKNFRELNSQMGKLTCEDKISDLRFNFDDKEYFLTGFSECPGNGEISCYFQRNILIIKK